MNIQKFIFLVSLFLSILTPLTPQFILSQPPKPVEEESNKDTKKEYDPMKIFSQEIQFKILSNLTTEELLTKASGVNKKWREMASDWRIWNQKAINIVGFVTISGDKPHDTAGYSLSNINKAAKILNFLRKLKLEKEKEIKESKEMADKKNQLLKEINSIGNIINSLLNFFNSPQIILNNLLELKNKITSPDDLPEGEQPAWPGSEIQINWKDEWQNLDEKWNELKEQETISPGDLNNQLFARLLIVAKAYLNKRDGELNIDSIKNNDLFKAALQLLSSQEEKYQQIRNVLVPDDSISLSNKEITDQDLPFIAFFLHKLNKLTNLKWLDLFNNQLTNIQQGAFNGLVKLKHLILYNNQLTEIKQGTFNDLKKLKELDLSNNKLTEIKPGVFNGLVKLEYLILHNNQLTEIKQGVFNILTNLIMLDPSNNQITEIKQGAFTGLENLEWLSLYGNKLTEIQPGTFTGLKNLKDLLLFANQLTEIKQEIFNGLEKLKKLDLSYNKLKTLPANLNLILSKIKTIKVKNAGLNNQAIEIPIEKAARNDFAKKLYIAWDILVQEGEHYIFVDPGPKAMEVD